MGSLQDDVPCKSLYSVGPGAFVYCEDQLMRLCCPAANQNHFKKEPWDSMICLHKGWFWSFWPTSLSFAFFFPRSLLVTSRNVGHTTIFNGFTILIFATHLSTSLSSLFKCQLFWAFHHRINYYTILT